MNAARLVEAGDQGARQRCVERHRQVQALDGHGRVHPDVVALVDDAQVSFAGERIDPKLTVEHVSHQVERIAVHQRTLSIVRQRTGGVIDPRERLAGLTRRPLTAHPLTELPTSSPVPLERIEGREVDGIPDLGTMDAPDDDLSASGDLDALGVGRASPSVHHRASPGRLGGGAHADARQASLVIEGRPALSMATASRGSARRAR